MDFEEVKIEIYVPEEFVIKLRDELNKINACEVGNYDNVISVTKVSGYWRPLDGANPYEGIVGEISEGTECKVELRCKKDLAGQALKIIKEVHPYEEPLINIIPIVNHMFY